MFGKLTHADLLVYCCNSVLFGSLSLPNYTCKFASICFRQGTWDNISRRTHCLVDCSQACATEVVVICYALACQCCCCHSGACWENDRQWHVALLIECQCRVRLCHPKWTYLNMYCSSYSDWGQVHNTSFDCCAWGSTLNGGGDDEDQGTGLPHPSRLLFHGQQEWENLIREVSTCNNAGDNIPHCTAMQGTMCIWKNSSSRCDVAYPIIMNAVPSSIEIPAKKLTADTVSPSSLEGTLKSTCDAQVRLTWTWAPPFNVTMVKCITPALTVAYSVAISMRSGGVARNLGRPVWQIHVLYYLKVSQNRQMYTREPETPAPAAPLFKAQRVSNKVTYPPVVMLCTSSLWRLSRGRNVTKICL